METTEVGTNRVPRTKPSHRRNTLKLGLITRLSRAEGQIRGIRRMIEEEAYCIDVLQQVAAVRRALDRLALLLLRDHLETCVSDAILAKRPEEKIRELIETVDRYLA